METITIPKENFDALLNLARTTIPAAGFAALNEFGIARSTVESLEILKIK